MKRKNLLNKKGFTLIELIVVIAILAILALILVPSITGYISKATVAKNEANARTLYSELALQDALVENYSVAAPSPVDLTGCVLLPSGVTAFENITAITCGGTDNPGTFTP